jgi:hypothetical protein
MEDNPLMAPLFWRIIIAVICVIAFNLLCPLVLGAIGFPLSSNLVRILSICVAVIALLYILGIKGPA